MSKRLGLVSAALVVFAVVFMVFASSALASYNFTTHTADHSAVAGTVHDLTRTIAGANPCDNCHIPHGSNAVFLWARPLSSSNNGTSGVTSNDDAGVTSDIKALCYSCHDGTIADVGLVTVFSATHTNHRTRAATATHGTPATAYGPGHDCDLCHDPHDDGNTSFLVYEHYSTHEDPAGVWSAVTPGPNVCASCHSGNADPTDNHPTGVVPGANTLLSHVPLDQNWTPVTGDYSGTRLFDPVSGNVSTAPGAVVGCQSCHTPHGADPSAIYITSTGTQNHGLNTMRVGPDPNNPATPYLCINCH